METQLIVRIDKNTKLLFSRIVRSEGTTASMKVRELVNAYIEENDFSRLVGDLWDTAARKLKKKGYTERDVADAVRKVRATR